MEEVKRVKVVLVGDQGVGKTSILNRFLFSSFEEDQVSTVGIDFLCKVVSHNNSKYKLQFWDTAGQERFRSLIPIYIRDCNIAIIVFDMSNRQSFESVYYWYQMVEDLKGNGCYVFLVGNKTDLGYSVVGFEEGLNLSRELGCIYYECSAKSGHNICLMFEQLMELSYCYNQHTTTHISIDDECKVEEMNRDKKQNGGQNGRSCC